MNRMLIITAVGALAFAGCTSVEVTREGTYNDAQLKMSDHSNDPYHIDWDVADKRVYGSGTSTCWFWIFASNDGRKYAAPGVTFDSGVAAAKDSATFDAVSKAKCDALLGCMYRTTKTSKWLGIYKETKSDVKGFPANVKSIELLKDRPVIVDNDKQIVRLKNWETLDTKSANVSAGGKKKGGFFSFIPFL